MLLKDENINNQFIAGSANSDSETHMKENIPVSCKYLMPLYTLILDKLALHCPSQRLLFSIVSFIKPLFGMFQHFLLIDAHSLFLYRSNEYKTCYHTVKYPTQHSLFRF